ncbi:hypothetical protein [Dongia sp. agr-C8]
MERMRIGSLLLEAMAVAARHWFVFIVTLVVLVAAFLIGTSLVTRCLLSPACVPTSIFTTFSSPFEDALWAAYRVTSWLICGLAIQRVLASEAARRGLGDATRGSRLLPGYGRCLLFLASLSAVGYLVEIPSRLVTPEVETARALWIGIAVYIGFGIAAVCLWAYVDARFALFTASRACRGQSLSFAEGWRRLQPNRRVVFFLFLIIETATYLAHAWVPDSPYLIMNLSRYTVALEPLLGLPRGALVFRFPAMVEFAVYLTVANLLTAGAFIAIYRRQIESSPEMRAAVFD